MNKKAGEEIEKWEMYEIESVGEASRAAGKTLEGSFGRALGGGQKNPQVYSREDAEKVVGKPEVSAADVDTSEEGDDVENGGDDAAGDGNVSARDEVEQDTCEPDGEIHHDVSANKPCTEGEGRSAEEA